MTRERYRELKPIMEAWEKGAEVQSRLIPGMASSDPPKWEDTPEPKWLPHREYRIKPTPRHWFVHPGNLLDINACGIGYVRVCEVIE